MMKRLNQYRVEFRVLGHLPAVLNGIDLNANTLCPDEDREFAIIWLDRSRTVASENALKEHEKRSNRHLELVSIKCLEVLSSSCGA